MAVLAAHSTVIEFPPCSRHCSQSLNTAISKTDSLPSWSLCFTGGLGTSGFCFTLVVRQELPEEVILYRELVKEGAIYVDIYEEGALQTEGHWYKVGEECKAEEGEHLVFLRTSKEANYWGRVGEEENEGRGEARATAGDRWPKP